MAKIIKPLYNICTRSEIGLEEYVEQKVRSLLQDWTAAAAGCLSQEEILGFRQYEEIRGLAQTKRGLPLVQWSLLVVLSEFLLNPERVPEAKPALVILDEITKNRPYIPPETNDLRKAEIWLEWGTQHNLAW